MDLIQQTNISLSSSQFHSDLINTVEETRVSLAELLELVKNLTKREIILTGAINETTTSLDVKITQLSGYSRVVREALFSSMRALTTANTTRNEVDSLVELFASTRFDLIEIRGNLANANRLLSDMLLLREELIDIANQSDIISKDQAQLVNELRQQSTILLDNTSESLANMCEAVENENTTVVHLRGIRNCTLSDLDQLLITAQSQLQQAISNSSEVLNRSIVIYDKVLNIVIPDYKSEGFVNASTVSLENAEELSDNTESLTNKTLALRDLFELINTTIDELTMRIEYLDSVATDLTARARNALALANSSVVSAEVVIEDVQDLLEELERELNELMEFLDSYNDLLEIVRRAENVSEEAVNESEDQLSEIQRIASITENMNILLQNTVDNLNTAMRV